MEQQFGAVRYYLRMVDVFSFLISTVIAFLGLLTGSFLAHNAPDETHEFRKYFPYLQLAVFVLVFVLFFVYLPFFIALALLVLSFGFIYFFWHKKNLNLLDYIVLGVLFSITSLNAYFHMYMTLLVFLFGIFTGALYYALHTKHKKHQKTIPLHKHSGKHLRYSVISRTLFQNYLFFLIIAVSSYIVSRIIYFLFFI